MTTSTQTKTPPTQTNLESLLEKWWPLIRAAAWRWADQTDRADHEDLVQEAALAVWRYLQKEPEAGAAYLRQVAEHAACDSLCRGKSIDRPLVQGKRKGEPRRRNPWVMESLEALEERQGKADRGFAVHPRRDGALPDPTAELALARLMGDALKERLTPRQRQVLELRLQECNQPEIAACLGVSPIRVHYIIKGLQARAAILWEELGPSTCVVCGGPVPGGNKRRRYCSPACKCRAYRRRNGAKAGRVEAPRQRFCTSEGSAFTSSTWPAYSWLRSHIRLESVTRGTCMYVGNPSCLRNPTFETIGLPTYPLRDCPPPLRVARKRKGPCGRGLAKQQQNERPRRNKAGPHDP